jgi:hypothetical protein
LIVSVIDDNGHSIRWSSKFPCRLEGRVGCRNLLRIWTWVHLLLLQDVTLECRLERREHEQVRQWFPWRLSDQGVQASISRALRPLASDSRNRGMVSASDTTTRRCETGGTPCPSQSFSQELKRRRGFREVVSSHRSWAGSSF